MRGLRPLLAFVALSVLPGACIMDRAPDGLRRTPDGPGARVRYDLGHQPLPDIPLPMDTATWPDPTSRTGLRINASLVAPTNIERQARQRFSELEGWGTFSPISMAFDVDRSKAPYDDAARSALDLGNVAARHQGDDYDFADDAIYLVDLATGVPAVVDIGARNFDYTIKRLDRYWANDTRYAERNLLFETRDESQRGAVSRTTFGVGDDSDFDGTLDIPNLDDPFACPAPDLARCDDPRHPDYGNDECLEKRRARDRCFADHMMYWYERETDTLILRPLLPLKEMSRYAVVVTDRLLDGEGHAVRSPFDFVYHASQEATAARVRDILEDPARRAYFGDVACDRSTVACSGLDHVAFTWSFTTQPTVDDMKRLRDGLYGQGPFSRWASEFPPTFELQRAVGKNPGLADGATDPPGWQDDTEHGCAEKRGNWYVIKTAQIREQLRLLVTEGFGADSGPGVELLLRKVDSIDHMVVGTYKTPFLLEGGPKSTDPDSAFDLNMLTGEGQVESDTVQFWMIVPKARGDFKQPFDVNVYGHGYTGAFAEQVLYAGNMAEHGLATVGINAMGHGLSFDAEIADTAGSILGGACVGPFFDALTSSRARDLDNDGLPDSGGDFWSSYLFHTRDGVRQSVLDHVQLVRIMRAFGTDQGRMLCQNVNTGWATPGTQRCDVDDPDALGTGVSGYDLAGDFDGDGVVDAGGPEAHYGTWGESLGGILSGIHGAIDPYVTAAVPGSGGGGLTDIGIRSFQGGVIEAVLLRIWGPLLVTVPAGERPACSESDDTQCTVCSAEQHSLRWVMPDVNGTGEVEIDCLAPQEIADTTVVAENLDNGEVRCAKVSAEQRIRVGLPSSVGDRVSVAFYPGDVVESFDGCRFTAEGEAASPSLVVGAWGAGQFAQGFDGNCNDGASCRRFQGRYFAEGTPLTVPAEGFGQIRQTPSSRRFLQLAQTALEPGDPISFAPFYSIRQMTDPHGNPIAPHAVLTLNTIGDMNVPLNSGIAFARATGALPFLRPDQASLYPEYADYVTPAGLFDALGGKTPNQDLIDRHVIEGIPALARHPASAQCAASANVAPVTATYLNQAGAELACLPGPGSIEPDSVCSDESEANAATRVCYGGSHCDTETGGCVPDALGQQRCDEALWDADDLDEGAQQYFENASAVPHRLARYTQAASADDPSAVWAPRLAGVPFGDDGAWQPDPGRPLTALLDAYTVPEGEHTFVNGEPCQSFDHGTYLTNLTARFFMSNGTDLYYLSHPATHRCLATAVPSCGYLPE
ncbi:MAG: hypothetical protein WKG00_30855 [Polyangiaceae bacterium]